MRKIILILFIMIYYTKSAGQIICEYQGNIGKQSVELCIKIDESSIRAVYQYLKYLQPINLDGYISHDTLRLKEGDNGLLFIFEYSTKKDELKGTWNNLKTKKSVPISLSKMSECSLRDSEFGTNILQSVSLKDYCINVTVSKNKDDNFSTVDGIKLFNSKNVSLNQSFSCRGKIENLDNIFNIVEVVDYNHDGFEDFSIFEDNYINGATSYIYFIYNPKEKIFNDGFSGTNLSFTENNTAVSHNSCCMGKVQSFSEYKIENGNLILTFYKETTYNTETGEIEEEKCKNEQNEEIECE